jgi:hypothetical protein
VVPSATIIINMKPSTYALEELTTVRPSFSPPPKSCHGRRGA